MNTDHTVKIYSPTLTEAEEHVPQIVINFAQEIQCPIQPNPKHVMENLISMWALTILIFAKKGDRVIGGVQSLVVPHVWHKGVLSSQELFFWITPSERGGSAAARMLREHEKQLDSRNVQVRALADLGSSSEGVARAYNRLGYTQTESIYTKWTT